MQPFPGRFLLLEVIEQRTERRRLPAKLDAGSDPCGLQRLLDELSRAMQASLERVNQPALRGEQFVVLEKLQGHRRGR